MHVNWKTLWNQIKTIQNTKDKNVIERKECLKNHDKKPVPVKKSEVIDGYTIKYHANGKTRWSKGKIVDGKTDGYWEWYRLDGTLRSRTPKRGKIKRDSRMSAVSFDLMRMD